MIRPASKAFLRALEKSRQPAPCKAVLHWDTLSGILIRHDDGFHWRCPACGRSGAALRQPPLGQTCDRRKTVKRV